MSGQPSAAPGATAGTTVRLEPAAAARFAREARQGVSIDLVDGMELSLWAPEQLVIDPVALDLDERGTLYVTSSSRNNMPLDIRQHPDWVPLVHTLKTVDDLRAFYERDLAPEQSDRNTWLPDLNNDGSRDLRDLAEMKDRVYRIRDTDGDGLADVSQVIAEGFNDDPTWDVAGGLLYHGGDLIFGMAPGVFRLRDDNGDGTIDSRTAISEGYNTHPAFGGHGISGVTLGPDGRLYWEVGDMGFTVTDRQGQRWSYPNQGAVLRSELDGSGFEVYATGIRNLQEFAFDEHGNLISVDNDGDHAGETERLVYITDGSDSGWRSNWQYGKYTDPKNNRYNVWMDEGMFRPRFDGQAAHIVPPVAPYHAGPSGMVYNPGTALSDRWRNHFFVSSFPGAPANARIYAFKLEEQGAGFTLKSDIVLLRGILTVGMKIGPDGALYLADWITGWDSKNKGRIWKVDAPNGAAEPARVEVRTRLTEDLAQRDASEVAALLRHVDMRVRLKGQFELVRRRDVQSLAGVARDPGHRLARLHGLWGIAQLARRDRAHAALLTLFLTDADPEVRAQAAKMIGDVRHAESANALIPLLQGGAPRARFFAAEALGRLAHKPAVPAIVQMLADNDDKDVYLRHAGSVALARIGDASAVAALAQHPSRGVRLAAIIALRRMRSAEVARFLSDRDEAIVTEAARAINDDGGIEAALPALARMLGEGRAVNEPLLRRAISASLRVGSGEAADRVGVFAADRGRPPALRAEAIAALGVWPAPSPLDRVDGIHLGQAAPRDSAAAHAAVQRLFESLPPEGESTDVKVAMAEAAGRLNVKGAAPVLLSQLRGDASPDVRRAALRALEALKPANMDEVMRIAFADRDPGVRRAALGFLPTLPLSDAEKVAHLTSVMKSGSVSDQQAALEALSRLKSPDAERVIGSYLTELMAGKLAPELQLDVLDAVESSGSKTLRSRLDALLKSKSAGTAVEAFPAALLQGGSAMRGRQVFAQHPAAGCTRCHSIGGRGSDVGPKLTRIGSLLTREQLLQALVDPNARIAPGFGTVSITLRNGQQIIGTLREETDTHVVISSGTPATDQRIAKAEITERSNPTSAMPPMGPLMRTREIRDVVEFLSSLK